MRLATFLPAGSATPTAGEVRGDEVLAHRPGVTVLDRLTDPAVGEPRGPRYALDEVTLLAPHEPRAVFGVALNYVDHAAETDSPRPEHPRVFLKGPGTVTAPGGPVVRPPRVTALDYEGELAVVVGADGGVGGYAIADDVSARDVPDRLLAVMKGGETFCPWGPWITTPDEVPDPYALRLRTWVDGEPRQDASTGDMIFRAEALLAHIGHTVTLRAGDLLLTGTPAGVGLAADPPRYLEPGACVRIEIDGLGAIEHPVVAAPVPRPEVP